MPKLIKEVTPAARLPQRKNVAAYARVSCGKDEMLHSLAAQVSYYSEMIQSNPDWNYRGVYTEIITTRLIQFNYSSFAEFAVCILALLCAFLHTLRKPCKQAVFVQS
jgi:hypothetical protein